MAERITNFVDGRRRLYAWKDWSDGGAWRIVRGEDFYIPAPNMAAVIRAEAHRRGVRATCRVVGDAVEFRFLLPKADERVAA
jgi:hypothetical protein